MAWSDDYSWNVFPLAKGVQGRKHYHHWGVAYLSRSDRRFVCSWCNSFWSHIRQSRPDEDNGARGYRRVWLSSHFRLVLPMVSNTQLSDIRSDSCSAIILGGFVSEFGVQWIFFVGAGILFPSIIVSSSLLRKK